MVSDEIIKKALIAARKPEVVCAACQKETEASVARKEAPYCIGLQVQRVKLEWWGHLYDQCGPYKGTTIDLCDMCFVKVLAALVEIGVKRDGWPVRGTS